MKPIFRFALRYLLAFLILFVFLTSISLIPKVGAFCNLAYRKSAEPILKTLLPKAYLQLKPAVNSPDVIRIEYASKKQVDEQVRVAKLAAKEVTAINGMEVTIKFYNTFLGFYIFLTTLILISPVSWKQKFYNLVVGSILFYLYKIFRIYLILLNAFALPNIGIYNLTAFENKAVQSLLFFLTMGTDTVVLLILWAILTFRNKNWSEILKSK
jgi:hypothetical protein